MTKKLISAESRAMALLNQNLEKSSELMRIEGEAFLQPLASEAKLGTQALRGAAVVFIVASFEAFLKEMFQEQLEKLASSKIKMHLQKLNEKLVLQNFVRALDLAQNGNPWDVKRKRGKKIIDIVDACKQVALEKISPGAYPNTGGNPCAKSINDMFSSIGIENVFAEVAKRFSSRKNQKRKDENMIRAEIDDVINKRHSVAHTANLEQTSKQDIVRYIELFRRVGGILEKILENFVANQIAAGAIP